MAASQTIEVPHLGGIKSGYRISGDKLDLSKPTCVLLNSLCTTVAFWDAQFESKELTAAMNLLAIEPLGHGATTCATEHFTLWDTATMVLQVMTKLGIEKVYAMGTSQAGNIIVRMALLAPERVVGIIPIGTSMDYESEDSRKKGSWDAVAIIKPFFENWCSTTPTPNFVIDEAWRTTVPALALGDGATSERLRFWNEAYQAVYQGDEGRKKARMAVLCLVERDSLLWRLRDVKCPVKWLHGTKDAIWPDALAREQIKLFTSSKSASVVVVEGGSHFLNITHSADVNAALLRTVKETGN